jgi:hypothetical protein
VFSIHNMIVKSSRFIGVLLICKVHSLSVLRDRPKLRNDPYLIPISQGQTAPIVDDINVPEITSAEIVDLPNAISDFDSQQEKNDYTSLSADDLKIDVPFESVITADKYLITQPPSACDLTSGPAKVLLDCTTTVAPVQVGFAKAMPTSDD